MNSGESDCTCDLIIILVRFPFRLLWLRGCYIHYQADQTSFATKKQQLNYCSRHGNSVFLFLFFLLHCFQTETKDLAYFFRVSLARSNLDDNARDDRDNDTSTAAAVTYSSTRVKEGFLFCLQQCQTVQTSVNYFQKKKNVHRWKACSLVYPRFNMQSCSFTHTLHRVADHWETCPKEKEKKGGGGGGEGPGLPALCSSEPIYFQGQVSNLFFYAHSTSTIISGRLVSGVSLPSMHTNN